MQVTLSIESLFLLRIHVYHIVVLFFPQWTKKMFFFLLFIFLLLVHVCFNGAKREIYYLSKQI